MRRAARRDENEAIIVAALIAAGYSVERISQRGIPDLLVGKNNRTCIMEVIGDSKAAAYRKTGGLTPAQVEFWQRWKGQKAAVRTVEEALRVAIAELTT